MSGAARWDFLKRALDICGALIGLGLSVPILLPAMLAVRLKMGTPVLFRQVRPGHRERPFMLVKLRTMAETRGADGELLPFPQRITTLGRLLRRLSIDELPQFWNVLKGEMSLVGPRPLRLHYLPYYTERERKRHLARPGITGLAQISGRNAIFWDDRLEIDVRYVETRSLALDYRIFVLTLTSALARSDTSFPDTAIADFSIHRRKQLSEGKDEEFATA